MRTWLRSKGVLKELPLRHVLAGQSVHSDELQADEDFWRSCTREWGCGSRRNDRYRDRVNGHNNNWFGVHAVTAEEWASAIATVDQLMPKE